MSLGAGIILIGVICIGLAVLTSLSRKVWPRILSFIFMPYLCAYALYWATAYIESAGNPSSEYSSWEGMCVEIWAIAGYLAFVIALIGIYWLDAKRKLTASHRLGDDAHNISELQLEGLVPTVWISASYAEDWYKDAVSEVSNDANRHNKRREIVFAACFLEFYIYEWVRNKDIELLQKFFGKCATNAKGKYYSKSLREKWKYIPPDMVSVFNGDPSTKIDLSNLGILIDYRNGLVHGGASRPSNSDLSPKQHPKPMPMIDRLDKIKSGWAVCVATEIVVSLHKIMKTDAPEYLEVTIE